MKFLKSLCPAVAALLLGSCATLGMWEPQASGPQSPRFQQDLAECKVIGKTASEPVGKTAIGTAVGAALGAVLGAIVGSYVGDFGTASPGLFAAYGAASGALVSGIPADQAFKDAWRDCMLRRGHTITN